MLFIRSSLLARCSALALAAGVALPALAQTNSGRPNFNYVGGGYAMQDIDEWNCDEDGLYLEGSLLMNEQLFLQANVTDVSGNGGCGSQTVALGVGLRADYGSSSVLYGVVQGLIRKFDAFDDSDPGIQVNGGIRTMLRAGLEANGFLGLDAVDGENDLYLGGGVNYWLTPEFSLKGSVTIDDDGDTGATLGVRYNF